MKKILLIIFSLAVFYSCENMGFYCYTFYNYSNKEIVLFGDYVPKDSIPDKITTHVFEFDASKSEHELRDKRFNDTKFRKIKSGDTLSIFIIDKEIYQNNDWEVIRDGNLISDRLFITKESDVNIYYYGDE